MHSDFQPTVYILSNRKNGALYVGVTSKMMQRMYQHREGLVEGHTKKYGIKRLMWFEQHGTMETDIIREKQIKEWQRAWKIELIEKTNPDWRDLAIDLGLPPIG